MSARNHYIIFPTDYYDELLEDGQRAKAGAFIEYFRDMKRGRVFSYREYAISWFKDGKKSGTAFKWIAKFKHEIELFFNFWVLKNSQHILDVGNEGKHFGNAMETQEAEETPKNRAVKKSMETDRKRDGNISNKSNKEYIYTPEDFTVSQYLFAKLKELVPNMKEPNYKNWAEHVRLMRERDGRTHQGIKNMINMIFDDGGVYDGTFWRSNIRSTEKLRKQYDQIALQVNLAYRKAS